MIKKIFKKLERFHEQKAEKKFEFGFLCTICHILKEPETALVPDFPSTRECFVHYLSGRQFSQPEDFKKILIYFRRMPLEWGVKFLREFNIKNPYILGYKKEYKNAYEDVVTEYKKIFKS